MTKWLCVSMIAFIHFIYGCWVFVEAPEYLTMEQLLNPDSVTLAIMDSVVNAEVIKSCAEINDYGEESDHPMDVLIFVTKDGIPVVPDENNGKPERGEITPERGDGWSDNEWSEIMDHWDLAYPLIKEVYGNPIYTITVEIIKCSVSATIGQNAFS